MLLLHPPHESFVQRRPDGGTLTIAYEGAQDLPVARVPVGTVRVERGPFRGSGRVEWSGLPAGGPYRLTVVDGNESLSHEVYVGDLWLLAGQSNMEGVARLDEAETPDPRVRLFSMGRRWKAAVDPLHVFAESPDPVHRSATPSPGRGAGLGLPFGKLRADATGVPQGLIATAHGGTSMDEWSPDRPPGGGHTLYGSMLASVRAAGQPLAGVLWFQGCSDTDAEAVLHYRARMEALVAAVRRDVDQPNLPWLVVQIGVEVGRTREPEAWHGIQEAQRRLPETIAHLDVCASADLEHDDWIHLSNAGFRVLAQRLDTLACAGSMPAPQPERVRWAPDDVSPALEVTIRHAVAGLWSSGLPRGFCLVDDQGRVRDLIYQVRAQGSRLVLRLTDDDLAGVSLCHGRGADPVINTYDGRQLPLPVFGPLPIEGLPPVSAWFRSWAVAPWAGPSSPTIRPEGPRRRWEGWNVIVLKDQWSPTEPGGVAVSWADVPEAELVIEALGDGPLWVWWDQNPVIADPQSRDLGFRRISPPFQATAGRHEIRVAMTHRGGEAWGFALRLRRTEPGPLPVEAP